MDVLDGTFGRFQLLTRGAGAWGKSERRRSGSGNGQGHSPQSPRRAAGKIGAGVRAHPGHLVQGVVFAKALAELKVSALLQGHALVLVVEGAQHPRYAIERADVFVRELRGVLGEEACEVGGREVRAEVAVTKGLAGGRAGR